MSARATFWAWRVGKEFSLSSMERLVLLRLADGASEETGECWYKQESIGLATGLSRSGVQKALYALAKHGLVLVERVTAEGRTLANTYRLALDLEHPMPTTYAAVPPVEEGLPEKQRGASDVSSYIDPVLKTDPALRVDNAREAHASSFEAGFEQFWAAYPRKVAKRGALKAWVAARKSKRMPSLEAVLAAIQRQGLKLGWFDGSCAAEHIPHPTTWLNQDRWGDELEVHPLPLAPKAADPAVTARRELEAAKADYRAEIVKLARSEDGWTSLSRTPFFDGLDALETVAEVQARLGKASSILTRIRASGAYPLRRASQPGEILPASGRAPIVVDLRDGGCVFGAVCPAYGEDEVPEPHPETGLSSEELAGWPEFAADWRATAAECDTKRDGGVPFSSLWKANTEPNGEDDQTSGESPLFKSPNDPTAQLAQRR